MKNTEEKNKELFEEMSTKLDKVISGKSQFVWEEFIGNCKKIDGDYLVTQAKEAARLMKFEALRSKHLEKGKAKGFISKDSLAKCENTTKTKKVIKSLLDKALTKSDSLEDYGILISLPSLKTSPEYFYAFLDLVIDRVFVPVGVRELNYIGNVLYVTRGDKKFKEVKIDLIKVDFLREMFDDDSDFTIERLFF